MTRNTSRRPALAPLLAMGLAVALGAGCGGDDDPPPAAGDDDLVYQGMYEGTIQLLRRPLSGGDPTLLLPAGTAAIQAAPSPDGRKLAYVVETIDETFDIYVVDLETPGEPRPLANSEFNDWQPDWSPDGTRIAFASERDGLGDIYVVNADGTDLRQLTFDPLPGRTDEFWPRWSPDGSRLAFGSNQAGTTDIWSMAADGTDPRRLTTSIDIESRPDWSPDGDRIVFRRLDSPSSGDIGIINADGTGEIVFEVPGYDDSPAWSPDGKLIAFASNRDGNDFDIYTMSPDGTNVVNRTNNGTTDEQPAWLPVAGD